MRQNVMWKLHKNARFRFFISEKDKYKLTHLHSGRSRAKCYVRKRKIRNMFSAHVCAFCFICTTYFELIACLSLSRLGNVCSVSFKSQYSFSSRSFATCLILGTLTNACTFSHTHTHSLCFSMCVCVDAHFP